MFKPAVLSIVLALAVGPNASLVCRMCHQKAAAASECHHEPLATSPSVADGDGCDRVVLGVAAFLREDMRRGVSSPDMNQAIPIPRYQLAHSTTDARPGREPGRERPLENRPLSTAVRI